MFPQDSATVGTCPSRPAPRGKFLVDVYIRWKNTFVMNGPTRVVRPENGNDTVSEGIGYGMLLSVYMGDKTLFDALYSTGPAIRRAATPVR